MVEEERIRTPWIIHQETVVPAGVLVFPEVEVIEDQEEVVVAEDSNPRAHPSQRAHHQTTPVPTSTITLPLLRPAGLVSSNKEAGKVPIQPLQSRVAVDSTAVVVADVAVVTITQAEALTPVVVEATTLLAEDHPFQPPIIIITTIIITTIIIISNTSSTSPHHTLTTNSPPLMLDSYPHRHHIKLLTIISSAEEGEGTLLQ